MELYEILSLALPLLVFLAVQRLKKVVGWTDSRTILLAAVVSVAGAGAYLYFGGQISLDTSAPPLEIAKQVLVAAAAVLGGALTLYRLIGKKLEGVELPEDFFPKSQELIVAILKFLGFEAVPAGK